MKVTALTSGPNVPSAYYRVGQYIPFLKQFDVHVNEQSLSFNKFSYPSERNRKLLRFFNMDNQKGWNRIKWLERSASVMNSYFSNLTWIQKVFIPYHMTLELKTKSPRVFDVDDAIWLDEGKGFSDKIAKGVDKIFAGNEYIADWFSKYNKNISIIPTAVDTNVYKSILHNHDVFTIGWIGTSGNFQYLYQIENQLLLFFKQKPNAKIKIIADRFPVELKKIQPYVEFVKWDKYSHVKEMDNFTVGIMPIEDNLWTRGKCSFKMLQYMSMEKPVIVSSVGMNKQVLERSFNTFGIGVTPGGDWVEPLLYLYNEDQIRKSFGKHGRLLIKEYYSTEKISNRIAEEFNSFIV